MQRCVGVGAAHGFLVRRDDIVMVVAQFIIPHGGTHGHLLYHVQRDGAAAIFNRRGGHGKFQVAQRFAHIAARALGQVVQRIVGNQDRRFILGPQPSGGVLQADADIVRRQRFELKHRAAG